ncbi:hypothetical protein [Klebsiella pneumoniae]|uniref:hypothetical protein n=1 Tax=Klebsiella pneumoniae TaxID=573 RepID=UPI00192D6BE0|nr:hypothetical protein [Klebsiella pneumoniae]MBL6258633.1 hypothetical protein [Klebsiella pneumoniae]MEC5525790.1 hypothetical protein [Klebsiella pneumoniae]MEC5563179.1 hypothetical protein [Klebsiella pneumoniae]
MVNFKDFEHDRDEKDRKYWDDGESQALVNMNEWIGSNNIEVVAVETMVTVRGSVASTFSMFNAFRLWYKEK